MKKSILLFLITIITIFSCDNNFNLVNTCSVGSPVDHLDWLKNEIQKMEESDSELAKYFYVSQASYKGETVFIFPNCCPNCNTVTPVKNCMGETIGYLGNDEGDIDPDILDNDVIIWKPDNFACFVD